MLSPQSSLIIPRSTYQQNDTSMLGYEVLNPPSNGLAINITHLMSAVKKLITHYVPMASVMNFSEVVQFYVDCYLYGSVYEANCTDPLEEIFIDLSIPTDYRRMIKHIVRRMTDEWVERCLGEYSQTDYTYVVKWHDPTLGVITVFGYCRSELPASAIAKYNYQELEWEDVVV